MDVGLIDRFIYGFTSCKHSFLEWKSYMKAEPGQTLVREIIFWTFLNYPL